MTGRTLNECRILVVEDEYLLADELRAGLMDAGAVVIGPVGALEDALTLIESEPTIDGAILDTNLQGQMVFSAADQLEARQVPYLFTTGYDASVIPARFKHVARCEKPIRIAKVIEATGRIIHVR